MFLLNQQLDLLQQVEIISRLSSMQMPASGTNTGKKNKAKRAVSNENRLEEFSKKPFFYKLLVKGIAKIFYIFFKCIPLYFKSSNAYTNLKRYMRKDYDVFIKSSDAEKEEIIIKWEKLTRILNSHLAKKPKEIPFLLVGTFKYLDKTISLANDFKEKIKTEFYPDLNKPMSQEYLKTLVEKFKHLPKDVLDDFESDKYSECLQ